MLKHCRHFFAGTEVVFLTGGDFYALRCSLIHQGEENIRVRQLERFLDGFSLFTLSRVFLFTTIGLVIGFNFRWMCFAIIGILATAAVPRFAGFRSKA